MIHMQILNNILKIYIAKLKLETAIIYSTDLKRTGHFFEHACTFEKISDENLATLSEAIKCKSGDREGKALSADEKIDLYSTIFTYQIGHFDTSIFKSETC